MRLGFLLAGAALLGLGGSAAAATRAGSSSDGADATNDAASSGDAPAAGGGDDVEKLTIAGVDVYRSGVGYAWTAGLEIDADGAPDAYGPDGGRDYLANAGKPGNWWGVATDDGTKSGNPVLGADGKHYVSTTSLHDPAFPRTDQRRYVDAVAIAFLALGSDVLEELGAAVGDLGWVLNLSTGAGVGVVIADVAPKGHLHEGSIGLAEAIGVNSDAKSGGASSGIAFVIFPDSSAGWPSDDYQARAADYYAQFGGDTKLRALVGG